MNATYDPNLSVPAHVMEAARIIELYFKEQGIDSWELMGLCSRVNGVPRQVDALQAVLLFYSAPHWTEAEKTQWWNLTQTQEATTRNLCDTVRLALGRLPSCFGDFKGRLPNEIPPDMRLTHEQRNALERLGVKK